METGRFVLPLLRPSLIISQGSILSVAAEYHVHFVEMGVDECRPFSLVLNVFLHIGKDVFTYRCNEIAVTPKKWFPIVFFQNCFSVFLACKPARFCLYDIHQFSRCSVWVCFKQYMNMILRPIHFEYVQPAFCEDITDGPIYKFLHFSCQYRFSVFCDKDHMVLKKKTAVTVGVIRLIGLSFVHIFLQPPSYRFTPIPTAW